MQSHRLCALVALVLILVIRTSTTNEENIKVFTVATESNDGYERYIRSARNYGIVVDTLGLGTNWDGGNMLGTGGGQKVNLLKQALEPYKNDMHLIVLFTDSYDVVFTSGIGEIVQKFKKSGARILFGAEHFCWPDESLRNVYPSVMAHAPRYLNSGAFIGYASDIFQILQASIENTDDDQLYYTRIFLNSDLRSKHLIKLDYKSEIFQNLHGAEEDVKLNVDADTGEGTILNINFMSHPSVIHGNGLSKLYLNSFANYLAGAFAAGECRICEENKIVLQESNLPTLSLSIFIESAVPFLKEFFEKIADIDYPKKNIFLFIHNNVAYHENTVKEFTEAFGSEYKSVKMAGSEVNEREARNLAVNQAILRESDYLFSIDADAHIDDSSIIKDLISFNRTFIAPVLVRPNELWSNFWGALSENGFYARSHDYVDIVKGNMRGMWNVPYVSGCYLIKKTALNKISFNHKSFDPDMALCERMRKENIFMFVTNTKYYGHLINNDNFNVDVVSPDFYTLMSNQPDWEKRYIHPDYLEQLKPNYTHKQPCPDVYWFPIVSEEFCKELIAIMEAYGKWSDGSNSDKRLEGGYEAVPTRDIHMNQVGLEKLWLYFLKLYVRPLQEVVFTGYYHNPPKALMNFVVRYRPDEQPFLRPHHDSSTYTINIALNRVGIDYEGGGCKFLRYNCSVTATKMGWMLMHPGRLTHFHEGLRVTSGTRYIMISFVDP